MSLSEDITRPIIGIENRTAQEVFDIMADRIRGQRPAGAGWSKPPEVEADHHERLSAENLTIAGSALSEWAYEHLAKGYGVSLTVREVSRLIAGCRAPLEAEVERLRGLRSEVVAFALLMEETLKANDHKGGWKDCDKFWLHRRLAQEMGELYVALWDENEQDLGREAADVANFAMMIADVCGALDAQALEVKT